MADSFYVRFEDGTQFGPAPIDLITQWAREGRLSRPATLAPEDGSAPPMPAASHPALASILRAPPTVAAPLPPPPEGSALIPARNPPALIGYYTGVFSLVPVLGLLLGPIAIGLGIAGWRRYRREPRCKGAAHAWVAIILGSLTSLLYWGLVAIGVIAAMSK